MPAAGPAQALVIGVYPSALHVGWAPPPTLDPREPHKRRGRLIGSLAVDVEPVVFWDGATPSQSSELARWATAVPFDQAKHGRIWTGTNGPSGAILVERYLTPLGLDAESVAFTDAVPWFFVYGRQRDAIANRFAPLAAHLDVHPGSLPSRPTDAQLVQIAGSEPRRTMLQREIVDAGAPAVITLGNPALAALRAVADSVESVGKSLTPKTYGATGRVVVDGHRFEVRPMVHPGFLSKIGPHASWQHALAPWHPLPPVRAQL
jgi:hypothetical protein